MRSCKSFGTICIAKKKHYNLLSPEKTSKRNEQRLGPVSINLTRGIGILRESQGIR